MQPDPAAENPAYHSLTITEIKEEANDVKTFIFGAEDAQAISYQPGQYLTFLFSEQHPEIRRSYSVTSAPALHEPLSVGVKRIPNGLFSRLKTALFSLPHLQLVLIYSNASPENAVFRQQLEDLLQQFPDRFKPIF